MIDTNKYLTEARDKIAAEKNNAIQEARQRAQTEQVIPFNQDITNSLNKALEEVQQNANAKITAIKNSCDEQIKEVQTVLAAERSELINSAQKKKQEFADTTIGAAIAAVSYEYDEKIAQLDKIING